MFICLNKTIPQRTLVAKEVIVLAALDDVAGVTCLELRERLKAEVRITAQQMGALLQKLRTRGLVESVGGHDEVFRQGKEWLDNLADPRVASQSGSIILSDNIQPRCGCSKPGIWQLQRDLLKQGKSLEVVAIATCPRCEAAWLWGEP